ncbi:hypothetical protein [Ruthenibacterium lactatiformans]|uniref:hypothetical protein n=1 Tax=Ruthenibacterium lactatiformans TaxID=1550024 RepID=UPI00352258C4
MSIKRMSLRFNLNNEADRKAWEYLKNVTDSKNKAAITAINQFYEPHTEITEVIRKTIRECLQNLSVIEMESAQPTEALSEEENELMDFLDMFLGK